MAFFRPAWIWRRQPRVGGHYDLGAGGEDVFDLSLLEARGHFRFGEVIAAGATAAHVGLV